MGADIVVAQWSHLDQAIASGGSVAQGASGLAGILLLLPESPEAPYLPIRVLQAVLKSPWRAPPRLWVVTWGAQAADPRGDERLSIDHAAAWGACRVIAEEHPDIWGGLIDLDPKAPATADASLVVEHVFAADGEDQIAIRGNRRFVLRLAPKALDDAGGHLQRAPRRRLPRHRRPWRHRVAFGEGHGRGRRKTADPARAIWTAATPQLENGRTEHRYRAADRCRPRAWRPKGSRFIWPPSTSVTNPRSRHSSTAIAPKRGRRYAASFTRLGPSTTVWPTPSARLGSTPSSAPNCAVPNTSTAFCRRSSSLR